MNWSIAAITFSVYANVFLLSAFLTDLYHQKRGRR